MEPRSRNIAEKIESSAKAIYEEMKHECTSYGELKEEVLAVAKQISWNNPEMGIFLGTQLMNFWGKDIRSLLIKKDVEEKI